MVFGETVGDGWEEEAREARVDVGVAAEEAVDVIRVEEGDFEAAEREKLGEFEHRIDMSLSSEWEDEDSRTWSM